MALGHPSPAPSRDSSADLLSLLIEASATLLSTPRLEVVLPKIVNLAKATVKADAYAVWRRMPDMSWRAIASSGLSLEYRRTISSEHRDSAEALTAPLWIEDVQRSVLLAEWRDTYTREGVRSMLVMPMRIEDAVTGTITFYFSQSRPRDEDSVSIAGALANIAAAAIHSADLYEEQSRQQRRSEFLAEAGAILGSSLDYNATINAVARLAVPHFADWCGVDLLAPGNTLERLAVAHVDPAKVQFARDLQGRFPSPIKPDTGVGKVLQTGKPELITHVPDELLMQAAQSDEHLRILRELQITSVIIVPLIARGATLGVLTFVTTAESDRRLNEADLPLAMQLAARAAAAIDNARLYTAIGESEAKFRVITETATTAVYIHDGTRLLYVNRAAEELTGYTREELISSDMWTVVHPEDRGMLMQRAAARMKGEPVPGRYEYRIVRKDGIVRWLDFSAGAIDFGGTRALLANAFDITERKVAEDALRNSEKLAAAGRLAATIAHEINNPLAAVTNLLYLLRSELMTAPGQQLLQLAEQELQRVAHIAKQTLGFYRESTSPVHFQIPALLDDLLALYTGRINAKSIRIEKRYANVAPYRGFQGELRQVLANVIANSLDAVAIGGLVRLEVAADSSHVTIAISDDGTGIPAEYLSRVFDAFFTTKRDVGTGLGLWVSKGIIEKHGGTISVESSTAPDSHGTTIRISLPLG